MEEDVGIKDEGEVTLIVGRYIVEVDLVHK